jgi:hypothetical protein
VVSHPALRLIFADGTAVAGPSATAILRRLGMIQWRQAGTAEMKALLAERVALWDGTLIDAALPDEEFLQALGTVPFTMLVVEPKQAK